MNLALRVLVVLLVLMSGTASAQDARSVVQAAATAIGATNLKTIEISGAGYTAVVGQGYAVTDDPPKFDVPTYTKVIDYDLRTSREEYTRRQGNYPPRGGGFTPLQGEPRTIALSSGSYAWDVNGTTVVPQPGKDFFLGGISVSDLRQLNIVVTPHGFLKAAMASSGPLNAITQSYAGETRDGTIGEGRKATIVSLMVLGKYRVNGTINDRNEVEMVDTWIPTSVGDTSYEFRYTQYKDFGGIRFPALVHVHTGTPEFILGIHSMEIKVTDVKANVAVPPITVPDAVRTATVPPVRVATEKLAEGVWFLGGGSHHSVAVEFKDFVTVIEAPLDEERSLAVIDAVNKLVPNKEIRYVTNSHHHFDHLGGLRTYASQGAIVVTSGANQEFYREVLLSPIPRTLLPDRLATFSPMNTGTRRPLEIESVGSTERAQSANRLHYVISDGVRTLELHPVVDNPHAVGMLMAYLPNEKILVNADLYTPLAPNAPATPPTPAMTSLMNNIRRLKIDVAQHVPIHGAPGSHADFLKRFPGGTQ